MRFFKKLGVNVKGVYLASKDAFKNEIVGAPKKAGKILKGKVGTKYKRVKYKKRKIKGVRKQLGWDMQINTKGFY